MPEQVFWIAYDERNPEIGMGFNSQTGVFPGTALKVDNIEEINTKPGQIGSAQAELITSHYELMEKLDVGVSVSGRYGLASGSVKTNFSQQTNYNTTSTFVLAHFYVDNVVQRGHHPVIPDGSNASELVNANRMDDFRKSFGDYYVRGIRTGGEYIAVIRITSVDMSTQENLSVSCAAEVNGLVGALSFKADLDKAKKETSGETDVSISYYQASGLGKAEAGATLNVPEVMQRLRDFPEAVANHPIGVSVELASYDTVPVFVAPLEEIENLNLALADAHAKRLEYLADKNNLEFAMANPIYFDDPPKHDVLKHLAGQYTVAVNAVMAHLTKLAKGQIRPAQMFDPSALNLDELPVLRRVDRKPPVKLPDFTKIPRGEGGIGHHFNKFVSQLAAAENEVERLGLHYNLINASGMDEGLLLLEGAVTAQAPPPGTEVQVGSTVTLQV